MRVCMSSVLLEQFWNIADINFKNNDSLPSDPIHYIFF